MGQEFRFEEGAKDLASGVGAGAEVSMLRFQGMTESIAPMCSTFLANLARRTAFRSGPDQVIKARRKETRLPIVAMSSGRLFLNGLLASIARLRFTGTRNLTCNSAGPGEKGTFLLCPHGGHFYFALTGPTFSLTATRECMMIRRFRSRPCRFDCDSSLSHFCL